MIENFARVENIGDDLARVRSLLESCEVRLQREIQDARAELAGQRDLFDADRRASEERTREAARAMIDNIESSLNEGHHRDAMAYCRLLRQALGLIEQPDLPPADTAPDPKNLAIGARLHQLRESLHMSQREIADALNVSPSHWSRGESGVTPFGKRLLKDICREFSVTEEWLLTGEGEPPTAPATDN